MPNLDILPASAPLSDTELSFAYGLAGSAVLACKFNRPTLRVKEVRVRPQPSLHFVARAQPGTLRVHRALLEETVMTQLAGVAARQIKFGEAQDDGALDGARRLLKDAAAHEDESDAVEAYLTILLARARGELRRAWAEVEIVTLGLREAGVLDGDAVEHRVRCASGIRSATLN
ncbi:hypothetical protein [Deinococcus yavapaiensis]|nr:hypothetical protein [Deinococcus yavapaiensis]